MRRGRTILAVAALSLLSGCGGTQSDTAQVRSVVQTYFAALANDDGSRMCSLMTNAAKQEVGRAAEIVSKQIGSPKALTCHEYLTAIFAESRHRASLERVTKVTIAPGGDTATARVSESGESSGDILVSKTASGWRIGTFCFHSEDRAGRTQGDVRRPRIVRESRKRSRFSHELR